MTVETPGAEDSRRRYKIWLLYLILPYQGGRVLSVLFLAAFVFFFVELLDGDVQLNQQLFYSAICAYSVGIFSRITAQSSAAFDVIEPQIDMDTSRLVSLRQELTHHSAGWYLSTLTGALFFCSLHVCLIEWSLLGDWRELTLWDVYSTDTVGTFLVWVIMTTTIAALVSNAVLWARIGRDIEVDIMRVRQLYPIGRVAILSMAAIVGAQVMFVILFFGEASQWVSVVPGLIATAFPTLALFIIPVWPLHRRLQISRDYELSAVDDKIAQLRASPVALLDDELALDAQNRLYIYRREVALTSCWPFDASNMLMFALYLLLPPLTWVGAALVEMLVNAVVS